MRNLNLLDRAIGFFDPARALNRVLARQAMSSVGGYIGARRDRRATQEWTVSGGSANADLIPDLPTLRERSRDLEMNEPIAGGSLATKVTNVVGTGLTLQSRIDAKALGFSDDQAAEWQAIAEREFYLWASSSACDFARTNNHAELQALTLGSTLSSGDVFTVRRFKRRPGEVYGLKLQTIEADRVANPFGKRDGFEVDGGGSISGGVQVDADGAPAGYHILRRHPGGLVFTAAMRETDYFPAFDADGRRLILHHFRRRRPEQDRGVPDLAPVIEALKQISRYKQAELDAAVLQAFFAVFVKAPGGGDLNTAPGAPARTTGPGETPVRQVGPASIVGIASGSDVVFADPKRPNSNFDSFVLAFCRQIGVALELPYELLVKHFTASYSAARAALLEAWKSFRVLRSWLASSFCQETYAWLIYEAVVLGRISAPGFLDDPLIRAAYLGTEWVGPSAGQIDELKEVQAAKERVALGISTLSWETARLTGLDWGDVQAQRAREIALVGPVASSQAPAVAPPIEPDQDQLEDETKED